METLGPVVPPEFAKLGPLRPRPWVVTTKTNLGELIEVRSEPEFCVTTIGWWASVVASDAARRFDRSEWEILFNEVALMKDDFAWSGDPKLWNTLEKMYAKFGLTPLDKHRLKWEADKAANAAKGTPRQEPGAKPSRAPRPKKPKPVPGDPRLKAV
jgi:hypothetical protein